MDLVASLSTKKEVTNSIPLCLPNLQKGRDNETSLKSKKQRTEMLLCEEGMNVLRAIGDDEVVVISVTGQPKTGKSYLLSKMVDGVTFKVDDSPEATTEGICIGTSPNLVSRDGVNARIIFLDTESVGNICTRCSKNTGKFWEAKIFGACFLVSSVIIYNTYFVPSEVELQSLNLLSNLGAAFFSKLKDTNKAIVKTIAPSFFWVLRDVTLKLNKTGCSTWKQYLETTIFSPGKVGDQSTSVHTISNNIKQMFSSFDVLALRPPSVDPDICSDLDNPTYKDELADFITGIKNVSGIIMSKAHVRNTFGNMLTGNKMADLLQNYVNEINVGGTCFPEESIWQTNVQLLMENILNRTEEKLADLIKQIKLPCPTENLTSKFSLAEDSVWKFFEKEMKLIEAKEETTLKFKHLKFKIMVHSRYSCFEEQNRKTSKLHCQNIGKVLIKKKLAPLFDLYLANATAGSLGDLCKLKDDILKEYNDKTNGFPLALEVRKEFVKEIDEEVKELNGWQDMNKLYPDVQKLYDQSMDQIRSKIPCPEEDIRNKHNYSMNEVTNYLEKEMTMLSILQQNICKSTVVATLNEILDRILHLNREQSKQHCEQLINNLIDKERKIIENRSLFAHLQGNNRQSLVCEYEGNAKGPYAMQLQVELQNKLDRLYHETNILSQCSRQINTTMVNATEQISNVIATPGRMLGNTLSFVENTRRTVVSTFNFLSKLIYLLFIALVFFILFWNSPTMKYVFSLILNIIKCIALGGIALYLYNLLRPTEP